MGTLRSHRRAFGGDIIQDVRTGHPAAGDVLRLSVQELEQVLR